MYGVYIKDKKRYNNERYEPFTSFNDMADLVRRYRDVLIRVVKHEERNITEDVLKELDALSKP